jgi:flagellum-specific ATP synthase
MGDLVFARTADGRLIRCLTEGFEGLHIHLLALEDTHGLSYGAPLFSTGRPISLEVSPFLKGCLLNGFGHTGNGETAGSVQAVYPTMTPRVQRMLPLPLNRRFESGVRSIDSLLTLAIGQRALFHSLSSCSSFVQKTTSMMARFGRAQTVVFGLIGYRQREVQEMMNLLNTCDRCVVFAAPSDAPAGERFHCAYAATTAAEYFRDRGDDVLLVLDSMQAWQKAYCELSLLAPEQARSLFQGATLAQLVERAGRRSVGSITGIYCLCGPNDSLSRQLSELVESRLVFSREMESLGVYPPIDVLKSYYDQSRELVSIDQLQLRSKFYSVLRYFERNRQLIRMGALFEGLSEEGDQALDTVQRCWNFLRQGLHEPSTERESLKRLAECLD